MQVISLPFNFTVIVISSKFRAVCGKNVHSLVLIEDFEVFVLAAYNAFFIEICNTKDSFKIQTLLQDL